ncbi:MAG: hypothetical protein IPG49_13510 [Proteobacteria bacterium]|nr:hypothetical protein [Pseudomonadota bacterium]
METPGFIASGNNELFSFYHEPDAPNGKPAFVLSHAFGEEKLWSHRVFVSLARQLAGLGHPVLRFDYAGTGDSGGTLRDSSIASHQSDLGAAVRWLRQKVGPARAVGLIGLRLGATVAALLAEVARDSEEITGPLILWDPITDGEAYVQELLRSHLSTQLAVYGRVVEGRDSLRDRIRRGECVNLDGYELAAGLHDSCAVKELLPRSARLFQGPCLVVQIAPPANAKPRADLQELARCYPHGTFIQATEEPFWKEIRAYYGHAPNLEGSTLNWLKGELADG